MHASSAHGTPARLSTLDRRAGNGYPSGTMDVTRTIATTHEVSLKGGNRRWFERRLTANVRRALEDLPVASIQRPAWRVLISVREPVPFTAVARRLGTVFGLHSILPVVNLGFDLEEVKEELARRLAGWPHRRFALRCQRSDKGYPLTSIEIEREVGGAVQEATGWTVDLSNPETTVHLLLDQNGFWLWLGSVPGPGGLPTGTGGRALCLLSGGIDSPVASYLMMKRGMRLDFVHFHSVPQTDPGSLQKVEELAEILGRYQGSCRVAMAPLLPIQKEIVEHCPESLRILLYRRFMLRLAERLAGRFGARALITGESLGQVASQTIDNLAAVEAVASRPVLRPLIGLDKQEIISLARRCGTYETSILPHIDCCTYFVPDRPETRADAATLEEAESVLDVEALLDRALEDTEIVHVTEQASWGTIPPPPGTEELEW